MADLTELAFRVEKLTGPCRETDLAILKAMGFVYERNVWRKADDATVEHAARTFFTGSIDAAMGLVPQLVNRSLSYPKLYRYTPDKWGCNIGFCNRAPGVNSEAATPALALCSAALRARSTQGEG